MLAEQRPLSHSLVVTNEAQGFTVSKSTGFNPGRNRDSLKLLFFARLLLLQIFCQILDKDDMGAQNMRRVFYRYVLFGDRPPAFSP